MARDVSILLSAQDNMSQKFTTIRNSMTPFRKDLETVGREIDALNKKKIEVKADLVKAQKEMAEAEKQFKKTGDELSRQNYIAKQVDFENVRQSYAAVSEAAKGAEKDLIAAERAMSKADNRAATSTFGGSFGGGTGSAVEGGLMKNLAAAGLTQMIGSSITGALSAGIGSAFGDATGGAINTALSGAISGAALGTAVMPGIGTAVGAAAGLVAGGISAATEYFQKEEDAFIAVKQQRYESAMQQQEAALQSGSGIAAGRETAQMSFTTMLGSEGAARDYLKEVQEMANYTPFLFEDLTSMSKTLKTFKYDTDELIPTMTKIGDAGAALGMSVSDMNMVATAVGRMKSSGKTSLENINILQDRGIDAVGYLAQAYGIDEGQVYESISKGLIPGKEAAEIITEYMGTIYEGAMKLQSTSFSGMTSTLQGLQNDMDAAMGEGYNAERKEGIQAQIDWLGGESGEKMKEIYGMIGSYKASLENEHEKAIRDAMDAAMESDDYKLAMAKDDRAEMGRILAEAQANAENQYQAGEAYRNDLDIQKKTIQNIAQDLNLKKEYWNAGFILGEEMSKGMASGVKTVIEELREEAERFNASVFGKDENTGLTTVNGDALIQEIGDRVKNSLPTEGIIADMLGTSNRPGRGGAYGFRYIPYDNFPALLHQGERVLTASEARQADRGSGNITVNVNGNFSVREDGDVDLIAQKIVSKIVEAQRVT